ncbi:MAG: hypothetical protein J7539_10350 [Niabella sp.]|nr:hypothetical protein [Niabella sp.]
MPIETTGTGNPQDPDVFKILKDLEYKAVGVDPQTNQMPQGYFVSFRNVGLPIPPEDFQNPWVPFGQTLQQVQSAAANVKLAQGSDPSKPSAIDTNTILTAGIASNMLAYINTFMLTDDKLVMSNNYSVMPDASHVSDAWFAVINGANAVTSNMQVSDAIKQSIADAQAKIMDKDGNPTPHYNNYLQYQGVYHDAVKALNKAYASAVSDPKKLETWPVLGKSYQDDVNAAWDQWQGFGFKAEIETATNLLAAQGMDPALALIARAKNKWENSIVHFDKVGDLPYTFIIPSKWWSADEDDGWTGYSQSDFHSESHYSSSTSSYSAAGGFSIGFFSIGASVSGGSTHTDLNLKTSNLKISFEYCTADIQRSWCDNTLLRLGNWFLVGNYSKNCISDGTFGQELKSTTDEATFLPSIVTSFILVRNLVIYWDEMDEQQSTIESHISGGGAVGFGPFMAGGSYSHGKTKSDFSYNFDTDGLHIDGVQLVGYVSAITPASPRLDSKDYMSKATASGNGTSAATTTTAATPAS